MSVASETIARVRALLPVNESRFSDTLLTQYANAADSLVRERARLTLSEKDITLLPSVVYYGLPSDVIEVKEVLYSSDGTNFDDGVLAAASFRDLDDNARFWKDETADRPYWYGILGTPGTAGCYLYIWRPISTAGGAIRVVYSGTSTDDMPTRYIDDAVLPYVMSLIYAQDDPELFKYWFGKFVVGLDKLSGESRGKIWSQRGPHNIRMSGGNL